MACVVAAASATFIAVGANAQALPPVSAEYQPALRSALVTQRELNHVVARWQEDGVSTTVLAREQPGAAPQAVARLQRLQQGSQWLVSVQQLQQPPSATETAALQTAALEQLYSLVFRMEPDGRYCLGHDPVPCDAQRSGVSHAQVLQALAQLRERSVLRSAGAVAWQMVAVQDAPLRTWDADVAAVQVSGPNGPLQDLAIHFSRAPHSICTARTGADGVASCRLQDQHNDGHQHDHATAVVVTFPGDLRPDRVLLPTTHVLQGVAAPAVPAFTRPWLMLPPGPQ